MRWTLLSLLVVIALFPTSAQDARSVAGAIDGRTLSIPANLSADVVVASINLLSGCLFSNLKAAASGMTEARKGSHVRVSFGTPEEISVDAEHVRLQAREIVITLPLSSVGIWVRSDRGVAYFAKFKPGDAERLQRLLDRSARQRE